MVNNHVLVGISSDVSAELVQSVPVRWTETVSVALGFPRDGASKHYLSAEGGGRSFS